MQPDVFVVDNVPAGLRGEILPTLRYLKGSSPGTRLVLGLRDIIDDPAHVRRAWMRDGAYRLLDDVYDLIIVYGDQDVYDVVREYGFSERAAAKTRFVGYLERELADDATLPSGAARSQPLVLVTAGGGGDGYGLFRAALDSVRAVPAADQFDWLLVGGPLLPADDRKNLAAKSAASASVRFLPSTPDLLGFVAAADVVVSMGGYNSLCEILSFARPALIVPRVAPRREQLIRASILSERGLVRMVHPDALTPGRLVQEIVELVGQAMPADRLPYFGGLPGAAAELQALLSRSKRAEAKANAASDG
jgi:predicted glycosyltransferase